MANELPSTLGGRYQVGEIIGRGGMAEVHIGRDSRLGRTVAIKALRSDLLEDPTFQVRFRREAQSAASLNHPNIVSVYDSGEEVLTAPDGSTQHIPYIVMEYVEGHTVRDLLGNGSALPIDEAIEISNGVLDALEYSHHSGIVHRDIKPANVMITPTGAVKVMDFGIARALSDTSSTMTHTNAVVGTAQYLSPEQARGETVDARSDLYSTGCLLYELLTGRPPFTGDSAVAVAYQHVGEQAPLPSSVAPDVPEALDRITMKALTKDRDHRYSSAAAFRSDLQAAAGSGIVSAPAVSTAATQVLGNQFPPVNGGTSVYPTGGFAATGAQQAAVDRTGVLDAFEEEPERKSRAWLWVLLVALLVGGIVAAVILLNKEPVDEGPQMVPLPALSEGMTQEHATRLLTDAELVPAIQEPVASAEIDKDLLVKWDPTDAEVEVGSTVELWFSSGPGEAEMPNVIGVSTDQALNLLKLSGFDLAKVNEKHEKIAKRQKDIVDESTPEAGQMVPVDSEITLIIATGDIDVPDVEGKPLEEATQMLEDLGLVVKTKDIETDEAEPGIVLSQNPSGTRPVGSEVYLEYAVEPPPEPEPTDEPTEEPTEDPTETDEPTSPTPPDEDADADTGADSADG